MLTRETYERGEGQRPTPAMCLAWSVWIALLVGLPPVLSLPGVLNVEDEALAFSGTRALIAFGFLTGVACGERPTGRDRRVVSLMGLAASIIYVTLVSGVLFGFLGASMDMAVNLGFVACATAFIGAFSCASALSILRPTKTAEPGLAEPVGYALLAASLVLAMLGLEPCWTLARLAFRPDGSGGWWIELLYDLAGIAGPGSHALRFGVSGVGLGQLFVLAGWLAVAALVARAFSPRAALAGLSFGTLLVRVLDEVLLADLDLLRILGVVLLLAGLVVLAFGPDCSGRGHMPSENSVDGFAAFEVLSPREREAVDGRLAGLTSSKVAKLMGVSPSTVRNLQARAASKLGVASLDELSSEEGRATVDGGERRGVIKPRTSSAILALVLCGLPALAVSVRNWQLVLVSGELIAAGALVWLSGRQPKLTSTRLNVLLTGVHIGLLCALELSIDLGAEPVKPLVIRLLLIVNVIVVSFALWRRRDTASSFKAMLGALPLLFADPWLALATYSLGALFALTRWGRTTTLPFAGLAFGVGVMLGAILSWPLFASAGLLMLRSELSGLISLSAATGLVLGVLLLLGLIAVLSFARETMAEERVEGARTMAPSFDRRVLALCESRGLNETQSAVVLCVVRGMTRREICDELSVAPGTVNTAKAISYRTFGVHSSVALVELVIRAISSEQDPSD